MNTPEAKAPLSWEEQKKILKAKFTILTEGDLVFEKGQTHELYKRLRVKLGKTEAEIEKIMQEL